MMIQRSLNPLYSLVAKELNTFPALSSPDADPSARWPAFAAGGMLSYAMVTTALEGGGACKVNLDPPFRGCVL